MTWLIVGVLAGMCLSYFWPHEPAAAFTTDRSTKFALTTSPANADTDAIFVLDFLTGRLQGHALNAKVGKFSHAYLRNVAADFNVPPDAEPTYAIVAAHTSLPSVGPDSMAEGVVYVAELTSGQCIAYGFNYNETNRRLPAMQMKVLDNFQFRQPLVRE